MNKVINCLKTACLLLALTCFLSIAYRQAGYAQEMPAFRNSSLPLAKRVQDLLSRLTPEEKINLLGYRNKAIPRLGIPAYNWWNEGLHGVARAGEATVFPQVIGMAASFDDSLLYQVATAISTEARAKYNLSVLADSRMQYFGLTYWSPNINIFRDPRWGRGQETYGEDPFLTGSMGAAYIRGMQGDDPLHLKTAACAKHFAVHSGPEAIRHSFNAVVDEKDLRETYLYAFRKAVNAGVASVMTAYNAVNGVPCPVNTTLIDILKKEWHFNGYILNDCGALDDIISGHKTMSDPAEVAAAAIKAGIDLDCGGLLQHAAMKAVERHLLTETEIDSSLRAILNTEFRLGFYDGKEKDPYHHYGADSVHNAWHIALAKKMAAESIVLLKNNGVLPLKKNLYKTILVTGPSAGSLDALVGSYHGVSNHLINFVEGITGAAGPAVGVQYDLGCNNTDTVHFGGVWASSNSDITIAAIGLTPVMEGEEGDAFLSPNAKGDRANLQLPASQVAFIKALRKASGHPLIAVVTGGSDIDLSSIEPYVDAIIMVWYPGEQGGTALADVLFGKVSPAGRLPVTFYQSADELPSFTDYRMQGRTYRYFKGKVEYPFGFGLSYTSFAYSWNKEPLKTYKAGDTIALSVIIRNTGKMNGDEVVQYYVEYPGLPRMPLKELKQFRRVSVLENGVRTVDMQIPVNELKKWDMQHNSWRLYSGPYRIMVGSNSMDQRLVAGFNIQ